MKSGEIDVLGGEKQRAFFQVLAILNVIDISNLCFFLIFSYDQQNTDGELVTLEKNFALRWATECHSYE